MSDNSFAVGFQVAQKLSNGLERVIRGRTDTVRLVVAALLGDGHVLLEDYPGSGKTTLSKTLGKLIKDDKGGESAILPFRRIQFTPDMLPGDVLGVNVFEPKTGMFRFIHGPIFAHVLLADEINRTGPKVQAAFLECMAEKQVTLDNVTHPLDSLFFVIGTQNPLDIAGTYPLPIVQLDRFLFRVPMTYVDRATEVEILTQHDSLMEVAETLAPVVTRSEVLEARSLVRSVTVAPPLREAIVDLVQATRKSGEIQFGASTRAALMLQRGIRAWAFVHGREYATENDLREIAPFVLLHRLKFVGGDREGKKILEGLLAPITEKLVTQAPVR